ncbi:MAG: prenyltransferase [Anaerolineae bacterium]
MSGIAMRIKAWLGVLRAPFHTVGLLPFTLGLALAARDLGSFRWDVALWGCLGVTLVMAATYLGGEYWDDAEDTLAGRLGKGAFSGGSQVVQQGLLPRHVPLYASIASALAALGVALVLRLGYRTGPLTLPFALIGLLAGFFYSARPIRWVSSGLGGLWIAFCYGWLPVAVGYYLQAGAIPTLVHWLAVPIGLTILNVILLNEFPDYPADRAAGKANWVVRLGRERAAGIYPAIAAAGWLAMVLALRHGAPLWALLAYAPILILSLGVSVAVLRGRWRDHATLNGLCGANLLVNLGTTAVLLAAYTLFP